MQWHIEQAYKDGATINEVMEALEVAIDMGVGPVTKKNIYGVIWTVESYNINLNKWTQKNILPFMLFKPGVVVVNNEIIVLGGQALINGVNDCSKKALIYKPKFDKWIETTPLPEKNVFFGCTSIGNKIYVIDGTVGGNPNWESYATVYEGEFITNNSKY